MGVTQLRISRNVKQTVSACLIAHHAALLKLGKQADRLFDVQLSGFQSSAQKITVPNSATVKALYPASAAADFVIDDFRFGNGDIRQ